MFKEDKVYFYWSLFLNLKKLVSIWNFRVQSIENMVNKPVFV